MNRASSLLQSARREAVFTMSLWLLACVYTVGYAWLFAYDAEPVPQLVWGMPRWVVWGIFAPWSVCLAVTCWYALFGIRDEDLGEERAPEADGEGDPHG